MIELLKVLDMSKDEQDYWTVENTDREIRGGNYESLADLAFRLRDEVTTGYDHAVYEVFNYCGRKKSFDNVFYWMAYNAKPIHWIIAALIAKERR